MTASFNLIDEPWIPCIDLQGNSAERGIRDTLASAHELKEVYDESPLVTISIYRLLLAILHRVFGPDSADMWLAFWEQGAWDAIQLDDYLDAWYERFDLFHPDPVYRFYQAEPDETYKPRSVIHLIHSQGNNPTLFTHDTDEMVLGYTPAEVARALLASQSCYLGGLLRPGKSSPGSPCARGINFLSQGRNLFETLVLNWFPYPDEGVFHNQVDDKPAWEMDDPFNANRQALKVRVKEEVLPLGYLDFLTWQNCRLWLSLPGEDGLVREVRIGLGNLKLHWSVTNPLYHYRRAQTRDPSGLKFLRFSEGRALWRDSAALLQHRAPDDYQPPYAVTWLANLLIGMGMELPHQGYAAYGMSTDQAKVFFYRHEQMPLPSDYLEENRLEDLVFALQAAENTARKTRGAAMRLAELVLSETADQKEGRKPDSKDMTALVEHWGVMRDYWGALEPAFWELVTVLPGHTEQALTGWEETLKHTAWETLRRAEALAGDDTKALKAAAVASRQLGGGLKKVFEKAEA
jgi:CRISPR system Cascade subunit CasA